LQQARAVGEVVASLDAAASTEKAAQFNVSGFFSVERVMGIEPTLFAWEARVLPLNDTRL